MTFEELYGLAEKELRLGMADANLVERAIAEANGVAARAQQIYWQRRAKALEHETEERLQQLISEIQEQERRLRSRKEWYRWFWAIACVLSLLGAALFPSLAFRAVGKAGPSFYVFLILSVGSLVLSVLAFIASRYHTHTE